MKTVDIYGQELVQIDTISHLRYDTGLRRNGLYFWVYYPSDAKSNPIQKDIFLQYQLHEKTKLDWIKAIFQDRVIYLTRVDYDITLDTARQLDQKTQTP